MKKREKKNSSCLEAAATTNTNEDSCNEWSEYMRMKLSLSI